MPAQQHRVTRGDDYRRTVRAGRRVGGAFCITHAVFYPHKAPARFGFIISKAVGNAVTRNLVRRRMKSIADRHIRDGLSDVDIVFRALPASATATFAQLQEEIDRSIHRLQKRNEREDAA